MLYSSLGWVSMDYKSIGARLRAARKSKKLSQEHAAELIGITAPYYGRIERGERGMSLKTLDRIVRAFGVPVGFILYGKDVE